MFVGIDIGSRTIKAVALKDGQLLDYQMAESGFDPHRQSLEMIKKYHPTFDSRHCWCSRLCNFCRSTKLNT